MAHDDTIEGQGEVGGGADELGEGSPAPNSSVHESCHREMEAMRSMYKGWLKDKDGELARAVEDNQQLAERTQLTHAENILVRQQNDELSKNNAHLDEEVLEVEKQAGVSETKAAIATQERDDTRANLLVTLRELHNMSERCKQQEEAIAKGKHLQNQARKAAAELEKKIRVQSLMLVQQTTVIATYRQRFDRLQSILNEGGLVIAEDIYQGGRGRGRRGRKKGNGPQDTNGGKGKSGKGKAGGV